MGGRRCLQIKVFGELCSPRGPWNKPLHFCGVYLGKNPLTPALGTSPTNPAPWLFNLN